MPDRTDDKQPMFDLSDCEDVSLRSNETTGGSLLKATRTKRIQAEGNRVAHIAAKDTSKGFIKSALKWVGGVVTALLIAYIVYRLGWN